MEPVNGQKVIQLRIMSNGKQKFNGENVCVCVYACILNVLYVYIKYIVNELLYAHVVDICIYGMRWNLILCGNMSLHKSDWNTVGYLTFCVRIKCVYNKVSYYRVPVYIQWFYIYIRFKYVRTYTTVAIWEKCVVLLYNYGYMGCLYNIRV